MTLHPEWDRGLYLLFVDTSRGKGDTRVDKVVLDNFDVA